MSRTVVSVIQIKHGRGEISITASYGITTSVDIDNSLFDVLERADNARVDARKCGSNTVSIRRPATSVLNTN